MVYFAHIIYNLFNYKTELMIPFYLPKYLFIILSISFRCEVDRIASPIFVM